MFTDRISSRSAHSGIPGSPIATPDGIYFFIADPDVLLFSMVGLAFVNWGVCS